MTGKANPGNPIELMYFHLKKCKRSGCDACVLAAALKAEMNLTASYRKGAEESGRRWDLLDAHEKVRAEGRFGWEAERTKLVERNKELDRCISGIRCWIDIADEYIGDR